MTYFRAEQAGSTLCQGFFDQPTHVAPILGARKLRQLFGVHAKSFTKVFWGANGYSKLNQPPDGFSAGRNVILGAAPFINDEELRRVYTNLQGLI